MNFRVENSLKNFEDAFHTAIKLLHSQDESSADVLKSMLDETLAQKKAPSTLSAPIKPSTTIKPVIANRPLPAPAIVKPATTAPTPVPILDDLDIGGMGCVVCKQVGQKAGNEIVECQECHSLYHQECHKPSLANENVKDPRFIWYCSICTSKRKKVKLPAKPAAPSSGHGPANKESKEQQNPEVSPFKSWSFIKK